MTCQASSMIPSLSRSRCNDLRHCCRSGSTRNLVARAYNWVWKRMSGSEKAIARSPLNSKDANWRYRSVSMTPRAPCVLLPGISKLPVGSVSCVHESDDEDSEGETVLTSSSLRRSPFSVRPLPLLKISGVVYLPAYRYSHNVAKISGSISLSTATRLIDSFMWPLLISA